MKKLSHHTFGDFNANHNTIATNNRILAYFSKIFGYFPKFFGLFPKNNRLHSFALFRMLAVQSEKEIAERGNSNNINWRTLARLLSRAFFVRGLRTPKENNQLKIELVAFLSMVGRNGQRLIVGCSPVGAVFHPVTFYRQAWKLAVDVQNLQLEFSTMLFKFLSIQNGKALKITVRADSEKQARIKHGISDTTLCVARYTDKFLSAKLALFPLSRSAKGAYYA